MAVFLLGVVGVIVPNRAAVEKNRVLVLVRILLLHLKGKNALEKANKFPIAMNNNAQVSLLFTMIEQCCLDDTVYYL